MRQAISRDRVKGFLRAEGRQIVNEDNEEVLLLGWGLGNWLLCEGYMWKLGDFPAFDRPRRIEQTIETLTGKSYAARFWKQFRAHYIAEDDLKLMARQGYNSLRVPMNARVFMEEGEKIKFREEGFRLLDSLMALCEKYKLYVFLDLHGAPGGQTGANIDDSLDDQCRLLIDDIQFERGLALWEEMARRYKDKWIVGGYDLLNEPIRPVRKEGDTNLDGYLPRLREFYVQAIARIRKHDKKHIVALEGMHWATDTQVFDRAYDSNMVIHFHRYWCPPDLSAFKEYLALSEKWNVPLWLGETGENAHSWFSAMIPLALKLGVSVTMWPWKKMDCTNSPASIRMPENWHIYREYLAGGPQPDYETAQKALDQLLNNIRLQNCVLNDDLLPQIFRVPGCSIRGGDFDAVPGLDESWRKEGEHAKGCYRQDTGMDILEGEKEPYQDGPWRTALLQLHEKEWVQYTVYDVNGCCGLEIQCFADEPTRLEVTQNGNSLGVFDISGMPYAQTLAGMHLYSAPECAIRLTALRGKVKIAQVNVLPLP